MPRACSPQEGDGAVKRTRTSTGCPTATSTLRVYQFRHDRTTGLIEADGPYKAALRLCEAPKNAYIVEAMTNPPEVEWAVSETPVSYETALAVMEARARAIREDG